MKMPRYRIHKTANKREIYTKQVNRRAFIILVQEHISFWINKTKSNYFGVLLNQGRGKGNFLWLPLESKSRESNLIPTASKIQFHYISKLLDG